METIRSFSLDKRLVTEEHKALLQSRGFSFHEGMGVLYVAMPYSWTVSYLSSFLQENELKLSSSPLHIVKEL